MTDLGGGKSINNREISLSSINTSRCHAPAHTAALHEPAWRPRTREGLCDGFGGAIHSVSPDRIPAMLAHVRTRFAVWRPVPAVAKDAKIAADCHTRERVRPVYLPPPVGRYFQNRASFDWPAGTGPRLDTVCFACPTFYLCRRN